MSTWVKVLIAVVLVAVGGAAAYCWFLYSALSTDLHHPDAEQLQRDLAAVPGVTRAEADYVGCWFACSGDPDDASLWTTVTLAPTASPEAFARVAVLTRRVAAEHPAWDASLTQRVGNDQIGGYPGAGDPDPAGAFRRFTEVRPLGKVRASFDLVGDGTGLRLDLDLPAGTTSADVEPAYAAVRRLGDASPSAFPVAAGGMLAADRSGFDTAPSPRDRAEWRRLSALRFPGSRLAVHLRATGVYDLVLHPDSAGVDRPGPLLRDRIARVVRHEITTYRDRTGRAPEITVWVGDRAIVDVGPQDCGYGLSALDDELNAWFWAVDCSTTGVLRTTQEELDGHWI